MGRRCGWIGSLAVALWVALGAVAGAQERSTPLKTDERRTTALEDAFNDVVLHVAPSVVAVLTPGGDELGFAVAVLDGTYLLTSRSIVAANDASLPDGRPSLSVRTRTGRSAGATVVGRNEAYDVALLHLTDKLDLKPIAMGSSRGLAVGQWVVTIGSDATQPLAVGVVSALDRRVEARPEAPSFDLFGLMGESHGPQRDYARVIQHDSPLDGARDGGAPLVDADGKLVGVNLASAYRGSAYAAPIDDVVAFLDELKAGRPGPGLPKPGFIGVMLGPIKDPEILKARGAAGAGVAVTGIAPGKPAQKAGVQEGDVIVAIDGRPVALPEQVGQTIRAHVPGDTVKVTILREKREVIIEVVVGEVPPG